MRELGKNPPRSLVPCGVSYLIIAFLSLPREFGYRGIWGPQLYKYITQPNLNKPPNTLVHTMKRIVNLIKKDHPAEISIIYSFYKGDNIFKQKL